MFYKKNPNFSKFFSLLKNNYYIYLNNKNSNFPYELKNININFKNNLIISDNIYILSDVSFFSLDFGGNILFSKFHNFRRPRLKIFNNKYLVYDVGGFEYKIENNSKILNKCKLKNRIISCDISENVYGVLTESDNYLAKLTIFENNANNEIYKYYFAENFISEMAINEENVACCGFNILEGKLKSFIYFLDLKSENYKYFFEVEENFLFYIKIFSNNNLVALGDKSLIVIDTKTGLKKEIIFKKRTLTCFKFVKDSGILISLLVGQTCEILFIDKNGNISFEIKTQEKILDLSFKSKRIAVLLNNKILIYNTSGKISKTVELNVCPQKIELLSKNNLLLFYESKIEKILL
ncbi:MAG: hypothetical protein RsTaC01_0727 [Candidatus Paraimprobicoccus trichonymphae]|uniref:Uncharacterized protein n=1 Tax=Candidatus Paraimprobicoccus trichonymphae TaxID=3033793 RepID=A0AA48HWQ4_9FIRM|nr:MAG: hypothetical protein RsTaC01_0727 [Candidatus Paraimprobicoccus trichonymphae]